MTYQNPFENQNGITDPDNPQGDYNNQANRSPFDENWAKSALNVSAPKNAAWWNADKALQSVRQYAQQGQGNQGDWINWAIRDVEKNSQSQPTQPQSSAAYSGPRWTAQDVGRGDVRDQMMEVLKRYGSTADDVQRAITENPDVFRGATLTGTNRDKLNFGNGVIVDVRGGAARGQNQLQWMDPNHPVYTGNYSAHGGNPNQSAQPMNTGPAFQPTGGSTTTTSSSSRSVAPIRDPRLDQLYNTLMNRASQGLNIDKNNPVIRQQADAFSANQERSRRNYLADVAERSGPNANLRNEARLTAERVGQATGAFEGELMGRELAARRGEIAEALNSMQGLLTEEQRLALTNELHRLDDATRRYGINTQDKQFYAGLGQQDRHFNSDLGYRNRALDQNDAQFRDRLGFDYADRSNFWDNVYRGY